MHGQRFTERTRLAHEHAATLAHGAIDGLDDVGLALAFGTGPVLPAGKHFGVGFPLVGKIPAMAVIPAGQRLPELTQRRFTPAAQRPAHNAPPGAFDHEPQPDFALFMAHKAPQLIQL